MESVLACALLRDLDFCSDKDYCRALDASLLAEEDPRLLVRLADLDKCRDSRDQTARVASWQLSQNVAELNRDAFAQALFGGLDRARRTDRFDAEGFVIRSYALWIGLPRELQEQPPFVSLKEDFLKGPDNRTKK